VTPDASSAARQSVAPRPRPGADPRAGALRWAMLAAAVLLLLVSSPAYADQHGPAQPRDRNHSGGFAHLVFRITSPGITESSSLVVSTARRGLVYTANDSGDDATIYVLDASTGELVGRTRLARVHAVDVEAMAACGGGSLVVGDVGDNDAVRPDIALYRLRQPGRGDHTVRSRKLTLTYPDTPHNAESVVCDPGTGQLFVVTKQPLAAAVYATPPDAFAAKRATLHRVAPAPDLATDATVLPGGQAAVIRTYIGAVVFRFPSWRVVTSLHLPHQQQGESVAAPPTGHELWVGSEGSRSGVLAVRLPQLPPAETPTASAPPATPSATGSSTSTPSTSTPSTIAPSETPSATAPSATILGTTPPPTPSGTTPVPSGTTSTQPGAAATGGIGRSPMLIGFGLGTVALVFGAWALSRRRRGRHRSG
jgi:hypothetical protein